MLRLRLAWIWLLAAGIFVLPGCHSGSATPTVASKPYQGLKIEVGVVGDPAILEAVDAQRGEWTATRGAELTVHKTPVEPASFGGVDVVLFQGDRLGDLVAAQALAALPESEVRPPQPEIEEAFKPSAKVAFEDPLMFSNIAPAFRDQVSRYGTDRMALPLGGSALVLAYRRDAFEREENREAAAKESEPLTLGPPKTWTQLDALARFFQGRDWSGDGDNDHGIALVLGLDPEGVGDAALLARAAALGQHRDQYSFLFDADSMTPRIDSPPFVEALGAMVALKEFGPPGVAAFDAEAARRAFREGRVALLIDRAERASLWGDKPVGVAPLPGSERVYDPARKEWESVSTLNQPSYLPSGGGWLVGVSRAAEGRRRAAAIDFAKYLIGPEASSRIVANRAAPMLPIRISQMGKGPPDPRSAPGVDPKQWSDAVSRTLLAARVVPGLRIPRADAYLAYLARARAAAVLGEPTDQALQSVARAWTEATRTLGTNRQLWHYRRSLNTLATLPDPPEN